MDPRWREEPWKQTVKPRYFLSPADTEALVRRLSLFAWHVGAGRAQIAVFPLLQPQELVSTLDCPPSQGVAVLLGAL